MFKFIENKYGIDKIFEVIALKRDESFIRRYLTEEPCYELNLFQYEKSVQDYVLNEISDDTLILDHIHEGRDLNFTYMEATLKHIYDLWQHPIQLNTKIKEKDVQAYCNKDKKVSYSSDFD